MNPDKAKYKISIKLPGGRCPHTSLFADKIEDRDMAVKSLANSFPNMEVTVVMQRCFRHKRPMRWRWDGEELIPTAY